MSHKNKGERFTADIFPQETKNRTKRRVNIRRVLLLVSSVCERETADVCYIQVALCVKGAAAVIETFGKTSEHLDAPADQRNFSDVAVKKLHLTEAQQNDMNDIHTKSNFY